VPSFSAIFDAKFLEIAKRSVSEFFFVLLNSLYLFFLFFWPPPPIFTPIAA